MIESCHKSSMIIFIDYAVTANLIKQIFLTTFNTNKLNLRFIRAFQFLSALFIKIKIKSEKLHVISDVLFRFKTNFDLNVENLFSNKKNKQIVVLKNLNDIKKLFAHIKQLRHRSFRNVWFHHVNEALNVHFDEKKVLLKMNDEFKKALEKAYIDDSQWNKIRSKILFRKNRNDISNDMNFVFKKNRLYYVSLKKVSRFCISWKMKKNIFRIVHDKNHHCGFHRAYVKIAEIIYIRHFAIRLKLYIRYCKQCLEKQTTKHVSYEQLISIKIMILFFHTITIDFIISFSSFKTDMNVVLIITDKYFKRISMLSRMATWSAPQWTVSWFDSFQKKNEICFEQFYLIETKNSSPLFEKLHSVIWKLLFYSLQRIIFKKTISLKKRIKF